ncbi:uncharacterized protein FOBCDRAFT_277386 [Fusarium oxysporum Fo47]|uniref:Uncharacterized protein n=1 Tax=Fusarium oxysporum Fo47 TaxID=660027 RepID=W9J7P2_FUSOX|nr:uncharacterized protein FOBCDRAFT_277386 [Fusarium oxysporum Fo47]EWZ27856.1 hypothetical protein FOZG_18440 [Fusarium oxysporum Fo47]QKD57758.1 hypothetical protein FOBCDRAFT_277386 [Fusarium oxysporum Fo47]
MPKPKHSHSPAPVDEPPRKRHRNHVSWANTGKNSKQADDIVDSTRPQIFQPGYTCGSKSSPSEDLFANGDSYNFRAEHQLRDYFSAGKYSNLSGYVNPMSEANSESLVMGDSGTWWQESSPYGPAAEQENLGMMRKLEARGLSNSYELGIKPTTSKQQKQNIGKAEQVSELWRDRYHIDDALRDLRKLEGRLQDWNKHQMVVVTSTGQ